MVSWWPADSYTDDIIGGNNGTFSGNASFSAGEVGQAFSFDGQSYVEVPDAAKLSFAPNAPITIDMWVYRTSDAPIMHLIGKRVGCGSGNYQMVLNTQSGEGQVIVTDNEVATAQGLPLNTWPHLDSAVDGSRCD